MRWMRVSAFFFRSGFFTFCSVFVDFLKLNDGFCAALTVTGDSFGGRSEPDPTWDNGAERWELCSEPSDWVDVVAVDDPRST